MLQHKEMEVKCCKKYHYPKLTDPVMREVHTTRGEACNMWIVDAGAKLSMSWISSLMLTAATIRFLIN